MVGGLELFPSGFFPGVKEGLGGVGKLDGNNLVVGFGDVGAVDEIAELGEVGAGFDLVAMIEAAAVIV